MILIISFRRAGFVIPHYITIRIYNPHYVSNNFRRIKREVCVKGYVIGEDLNFFFLLLDFLFLKLDFLFMVKKSDFLGEISSSKFKIKAWEFKIRKCEE